MGRQDTSLVDYCAPNNNRKPTTTKDHEKVVINDTSILHAQQLDPTSIIMLDIKLRKQLWIAAQTTARNVETKIIIQGPITNVCMFVQKHNYFPDTGTLRTHGFISPWEECVLTVDLDNNTDNDIM